MAFIILRLIVNNNYILRDIEAKKEMEHQIILYKSELSDLEQEMEKNKSKQNELLEFTSKLTEKNTLLQSENLSLNEKLETIKTDLEKTQSELLKTNDLVKNEVIFYFFYKNCEHFPIKKK